MLGQTYYHQTIRKYVVLFGTLFNDLNIEKKNSSGDVVSRQKVPIAYGPKQKFLTRIRQDPNINRQVAIQLPRMGFELTSLTYDPIRKLNSVGKILIQHHPYIQQYLLGFLFFLYHLWIIIQVSQDSEILQFFSKVLSFL